MIRKDRQYTANKWNKPAFMSKANLFDGGGETDGEDAGGFAKLIGLGKASKGTQAGIAAAANVAGGLGKSLLSNGLSTSIGNNIANIGSALGSGLAMIPGIGTLGGAAIGLASNLVGGVVNAGWGHKVFGKENQQAYMRQMSGMDFGGSNDQLAAQMSSLNKGDRVTYKDGWFTNKGKKEAAKLNKQQDDAYDLAVRSFGNSAVNNMNEQQEDMLANFAAYGGALRPSKGCYSYGGSLVEMLNNDDMGAVGYGLMTDYLASKDRQSRQKDKMTQAPAGFGNPMGIFALGGTLQSNGANWSNVTNINEGSSHELNPNDGVQMGVDGNGVPNLVEEGEVVFNDFVYSNRLVCPKAIRAGLGVRGKKDMTFAEVAKKLTKESEERPNDPMSKSALKALMGNLAEAQESFKKEQEAARAKAEFEALSPEEQASIMRQRDAQPLMQNHDSIPMEMNAIGEETPFAYGGNLYAFGDYLKKYFAGETYDNILQGMYNASGIKDTDYDTWKQKYNNLDTLSDEDQRLLLPMLQQYYYTKNPEAANSKAQFDFSPTSTWNPLVIGTTAAQGDYWNGTAGTPKADWYKSISEDTFLNDPAYLELADEQKKLKGQALAKALEDTKAYKQFRDYISADEDRALQWLGNLAEHGSKYAGNRIRKNDDGTYSWDDKYSFKDFGKMMQDISYDADTNKEALSVGHLTSSPQTQWAERAFVKNADGTYSRIASPTSEYELINADPYLSTDGTLNYKDSYYRLKPNAENQGNGSNTEAGGDEEDAGKDKARHRDEWMRYAGIAAPLVNMGLWAAGVGKPDTSGLDAAVSASGVPPIMAGVEHIGDYMTYRPFDRNYYANKLQSQAGATRRAIMNAGLGASRGANILAADFNHQGKLGDLYRQAEEYNLGQRERVKTFNRDTNKFNAEADNRALLQYASDYNNQKRYNVQLQMEAARQKMEADASWNQGLYGNINALATALGNLGKENASKNTISRMGANGLFGVIRANDGGLGEVILKEDKKKAHGGKINKKRRGGLTF